MYIKKFKQEIMLCLLDECVFDHTVAYFDKFTNGQLALRYH